MNDQVRKLGGTPVNFADGNLSDVQVEQIQGYGYESIIDNSRKLYDNYFKNKTVVGKIDGKQCPEYRVIHEFNDKLQPRNPYPWNRLSDVTIHFSLSTRTAD
jgi:hypothetical protein